MSAATPLIAGGVLAVAELVFSLLRREGDPKPAALHRIVCAAGAAAGAVVVSALVLLAATAHVGRSLPMTIAGTAAAVIAVVLLSRVWNQ